MTPRTRRILDAVLVWGGLALLLAAGIAVSGLLPLVFPGLETPSR